MTKEEKSYLKRCSVVMIIGALMFLTLILFLSAL